MTMSDKERKLNLIEEIDKLTLSPEKRAIKVFEALKHYESIDTWDTICFCANYLALMSAEPNLGWLEDDAKRLTRLIYTAHYEHFRGLVPEELQRKL